MRDLGHTHSNLASLVAEEIRTAILSGDLAPGEHLKQVQLAESLNVSRIPVREALRILESEGLIESTPGKGSRVVQVTKADAEDVLMVRGALEGLAAKLAAKRATPDEIADLHEVIRLGRAASEADDHARSSELHTEFHIRLAKASGNTHLYEELAAMPAKTEWINATLLQTRGSFSWAEHESIAEAVAGGDSELAARLMRQHSGRVVATLEATVEEPAEANDHDTAGAPTSESA